MTSIKIRFFDNETMEPKRTVTIPLVVAQAVARLTPASVLTLGDPPMNAQTAREVLQAIRDMLNEAERLKNRREIEDGLLIEIDQPPERVVVSLE